MILVRPKVIIVIRTCPLTCTWVILAMLTLLIMVLAGVPWSLQ